MDRYLEVGDDQCEFNYGLDLHLKERDEESVKYLKSTAGKGKYIVAFILTDGFKSASNEGIGYLRKSSDQNFD